MAVLPVPTVWAGHRHYASRALLAPTTLDQLASIVTAGEHVRAIGSRHSFTDLADSPGVLVTLQGLVQEPVLDAETGTVTVSAGTTYGVLGPWLHDRGWALGALASLPHISVVGAVTTATHGSGDAVTTLAGTVVALEILGADGTVRRLERGDEVFAGSVVSLGALGIVTQVTLAVEPTYDVAQTVIDDADLTAVLESLAAVHASATSVSVFTRWDGRCSIWRKHRTDVAPALDLSGLGGTPADGIRHPIPGVDGAACTPQLGEPGPWFARLPHFRLEFTPSAGGELQSEHLVPRELAPQAVAAVRPILEANQHLVLVSELRSMAADDLWLSSAYERPTVGIHTTWVQDEQAVRAVLPAIEAALEPFSYRPHWGKVFATTEVAHRYPRWDDAVALVREADPTGVFAGPFTERVGLR
ncbi:FAD-binding protein [Serinibacter arcticus]|uniref:FAD-binding protein n=1 Tax=Serinibacter arcticus TaxID=1655435 RepID=A0A2U1ZZ71_9MICO|nr:FAD-binding protein [Serinibacter arcticus]